ncbi:hypothetical protein ABEB36_015564 [Hypothenemus hampei]|uniref:Uncharacterized protein n=1 Tax=Hypothenemus hampei TaxID=57062 RepID=A0ABD1DZJ5_HYPHA
MVSGLCHGRPSFPRFLVGFTMSDSSKNLKGVPAPTKAEGVSTSPSVEKKPVKVNPKHQYAFTAGTNIAERRSSLPRSPPGKALPPIGEASGSPTGGQAGLVGLVETRSPAEQINITGDVFVGTNDPSMPLISEYEILSADDPACKLNPDDGVADEAAGTEDESVGPRVAVVEGRSESTSTMDNTFVSISSSEGESDSARIRSVTYNTGEDIEVQSALVSNFWRSHSASEAEGSDDEDSSMSEGPQKRQREENTPPRLEKKKYRKDKAADPTSDNQEQDQTAEEIMHSIIDKISKIQKEIIDSGRLRAKELDKIDEMAKLSKTEPENNVRNPICEACINIQELNIKRQETIGDYSYNTFLNVPEETLEGDVLARPAAKRDELWETPFEQDILLTCNKTFSLNTTSDFIKTTGCAQALKRQNKVMGETAKIGSSMSFEETDGTTHTNNRSIFCPIVLNDEGILTNEEMAFRVLDSIKMVLVNRRRKCLAVSEKENVKIIRMLRFLLTSSGVDLVVYGARGQTYASRLRGHSSAGRVGPSPRPANVIAVQMAGKSQDETLQLLKSKINIKATGAEIKGISKARNGDLLVTVQNGTAKATALLEEIKKLSMDIKATHRVNKTVLHIKGLDYACTEQEIRHIAYPI